MTLERQPAECSLLKIGLQTELLRLLPLTALMGSLVPRW